MIKHIDIEPGEGIEAFKNCKLEREPYADILTSIVSTYADGFVLALNNEWGVGKTTFIKMWREKLNYLGFPTLYYNAWENDFEENILVAFLSELEELKTSKTQSTFDSISQKGAKLTQKIGPPILKGVIKKLTGINTEEILEAIQGAAELGFESLDTELKAYADRKKTLEGFKQNLKDFVSKTENDKPIIFFIDELDRCRPNYAVEVLENIKHLFSVPGIVFVLSIDKEQLGHAVRGVYGSDHINADEYLRRFIDLEYVLPKPEINAICHYLYQYFLFNDFVEHEQRKGTSAFGNDKEYFLKFSAILLSNTNLNFRQTEKLFALARVGLKTFKLDNYLFPRLYLLLTYLKVYNPLIFRRIESKNIEVQPLIDEVENLFNIKIGKERTVDLLIFTIVELAISYHNYYYEDIYPGKGLFVEESEPRVLYFNSKFDYSENKQVLSNAYDSLRYKLSPHNLKIDFFLKKINLLDSIAV